MNKHYNIFIVKENQNIYYRTSNKFYTKQKLRKKYKDIIYLAPKIY